MKTTNVTARHEAVGPYIVKDERGYTAGYSIACACQQFTGDLHLLDSRDPAHRAPQVAAIKDHWRHLLDLYAPTKETA